MLQNIFQNIPDHLPEELLETLLKHPHVRIERIVSRGHKTASDFWYDQNGDEWVLLLQGWAVLEYEHLPPINLAAGDYLLIPAHQRHRVARTADNMDTVWLAVHLCHPDIQT